MTLKQLSVFLENTSGRLAEVTAVLAEANINISAFSLAETADYGILRLIVQNPERAELLLHEKGFSVHITDVVGILVPHKPGGLQRALQVLADAKISIEYMYAFAHQENAIVVIRTESLQQTLDVLQRNGIRILRSADV